MVIYLVRHPETKWNKRGITQGHADSTLTKKGKKTAEYLGKVLKNKKISKMYTSDLGRCIQTSKLINKELGVRMIPKKALREQNFGEYNGEKASVITKTFDKFNPKRVMPKGESFNQMKKRVLECIKKLDDTKHLLVVTHEGCLRAILSQTLKVTFSSPKCNTNPKEIILLRKDKQKLEILKKKM